MKKCKGIIKCGIFKEVGEIQPKVKMHPDRFGYVLVEGSDRENALSLVKDAMSNLKIGIKNELFGHGGIIKSLPQDIGRCLKLIEAAKKSGFDAIKFQAFKVEELFSKEILRKSPEHLERKSGNSQLNFYPRLGTNVMSEN